MLTTNNLFDEVIHKRNLPSDYALSKVLGVTASSISLHRKKPHGMDSKLALEVAKHTKLLPEYVLVCAAFERAKSHEEREAWQRLGFWIDLRYKELQQGYYSQLKAAQEPAGYRS